jgi:hypothetical protein
LRDKGGFVKRENAATLHQKRVSTFYDKNGHRKMVYVRLGLPVVGKGVQTRAMNISFDSLKEKKLTDKEKVEIHNFLQKGPIKTVKADFIKAENNKKAKEKTLEWIEKTGRKTIHREDIGEVIFDRAGVKTSFEHRIYQNKLDALPAIPDVIKKGKIIDISNDFDGKPIKNSLIIGPIQIGEKPAILVIRLRMVKGHDNKFYVHDIFVADELVKNTGNTIKAGSAGKPVGGSSKSIAHIKSILQDILIVKENEAPEISQKKTLLS